MIEKFKKFVSDEIYNQLCYYQTTHIVNPTGMRFFLTPYEDYYEHVKRQVCYFVALWDAPIYIIHMNPNGDIVVEIREVS